MRKESRRGTAVTLVSVRQAWPRGRSEGRTAWRPLVMVVVVVDGGEELDDTRLPTAALPSSLLLPSLRPSLHSLLLLPLESRHNLPFFSAFVHSNCPRPYFLFSLFPTINSFLSPKLPQNRYYKKICSLFTFLFFVTPHPLLFLTLSSLRASCPATLLSILSPFPSFLLFSLSLSGINFD